ncbi:hypothetical protein NDU88_003336 [Pleurodeles waltl]|uniref:Uncharacterized protein n=1 Tax=Pleurodeles waltl TaxID=8319 RepID=A0AAV7RI94_PLEWA|nr:hypothetical protein NDU88_003336 [Pleurodeles waltl]
MSAGLLDRMSVVAASVTVMVVSVETKSANRVIWLYLNRGKVKVSGRPRWSPALVQAAGGLCQKFTFTLSCFSEDFLQRDEPASPIRPPGALLRIRVAGILGGDFYLRTLSFLRGENPSTGVNLDLDPTSLEPSSDLLAGRSRSTFYLRT